MKFMDKQKFKNSCIRAVTYLSSFIYALFLNGNPLRCEGSTFWSTGAGDEGLAAVAAMYQHWFIFILLIELFLYAISKDEKKKGAAKATCIGSCLVYALTLDTVQSLLTNTISGIAGWF